MIFMDINLRFRAQVFQLFVLLLILPLRLQAVQSADSLSVADLKAFRLILTEDERKEFDRQKTDEARRLWAKLYWKRRDPTPTTDRNERFEEFMRRLAYVRQWFAAPTELGFDDRGIIYLRYGEPSQRYEQPVGDLLVRPNESWSYSDVIPGLVFDFVNRGSYYRLVDDLSQALAARTEPGPEMQNLISLYESRSHIDPKYDDIASELRRILTINMGDAGARPDPRNYAIGNLNLARQRLAEMTGDITRIKVQAPTIVFRHDYQKKPLAVAHSMARFRGTQGRVRVELYYGVPYNQLKFEQAGRFWRAHLKGSVAIFDSLYHRVATDSIDTDVLAPTLVATLRGAYISQFNFELPPGAYHMALRVECEAADRLGILRADFECPRYPEDRLAMSDLQLSPQIVIPYRNTPTDTAAAGLQADRFLKNGLRIMPLPGLTIDRSRMLYVYFEIYNLAQNAAGKTRYDIEYALRELEGGGSIVSRLFGGKKPVLAVTETREGVERNPVEHIGIELKQQPEGKYMLTVSVRDRIHHASAEASVPIRIVSSIRTEE